MSADPFNRFAGKVALAGRDTLLRRFPLEALARLRIVKNIAGIGAAPVPVSARMGRLPPRLRTSCA